MEVAIQLRYFLKNDPEILKQSEVLESKYKKCMERVDKSEEYMKAELSEKCQRDKNNWAGYTEAYISQFSENAQKLCQNSVEKGQYDGYIHCLKEEYGTFEEFKANTRKKLNSLVSPKFN